MHTHNNDEFSKILKELAEIKGIISPDLQKINFVDECSLYCATLRQQGRARSALCYERSLRAFEKFLGRGPQFSDINKATLAEYYASLLNRVSTNTAKAYLVDLRVLYNNSAGIHDISARPFGALNLARHSGRGLRALSAAQIRALANLAIKDAKLAAARDIFLISFLCGGVNYCDLWNMRPPVGGRLSYRRQKSARRAGEAVDVSIELPPAALSLAARLQRRRFAGRWLGLGQGSRGYENFLKEQNELLKGVARLARLPVILTSYFARHSWASIARNNCGIDIYDISQVLGHVPPAARIDLVYINKNHARADDAVKKVAEFCINSLESIAI